MHDQDLKAALETAIHLSAEPMVLTDPSLPDNPIIVMNDAFQAVTGFPPDLVLGRNCRFLQGPRTDPETIARIRRALQAGQGCVEWIVNHRPEGRPYWNLLFISPIRLPGSAGARFFLGNQLDITLGIPERLGEVVFGRAQMTREIEQEFHDSLAAILAGAPHDGQPNLDATVAHARRLAELSTRLSPADPLPIPALT